MRWKYLIPPIAMLMLLLMLVACTSEGTAITITPEQLAEARQQVQATRAQLAVLPEEDPGRIAAEQKLADFEALLSTYEQHLTAQTVPGPDGTIIAGVQTVAPMLPAPWNAVALLSAGLIPGVLGWARESQRRRQAKQAGVDLARAIRSAAMAHGNVLDFNDEQARRTLKSIMTAEARAVVDESGAKIPHPLFVSIDVDATPDDEDSAE